MGEREEIAQHILLVVHQDVGVPGVGAGGERAAALPLVLVAVDPPLDRETAGQGVDILAAKRLERLADDLHRLLVRRMGFDTADQGDVHVPVGEVPHSEDLLAQLVIAMKDRQARMDALDQPVVDAGRHVIGEERHLPAGWIGTNGVPEDILFHLTLVEAEKGVAVPVVSGIELFVRLLPERPILAHQKGGEGGLGQRLVSDPAEVEIDVRQVAERVSRRLRTFPLERHDPLFPFTEDVGLVAHAPHEKTLYGSNASSAR